MLRVPLRLPSITVCLSKQTLTQQVRSPRAAYNKKPAHGEKCGVELLGTSRHIKKRTKPLRNDQVNAKLNCVEYSKGRKQGTLRVVLFAQIIPKWKKYIRKRK